MRVYSGNKLPPKGPNRDAVIERVVELAESGLSYHNIAIRLNIPFGSISRIIREHKDKVEFEQANNLGGTK